MKKIKIFLTVLMMLLSLFFYKLFSPTNEITIGVIDRVEEAGLAVILVESEEKQIEIPLSELAEGSMEGDVLQLQVKEDTYKVIRLDEALTKQRKVEMEAILQRLRSKKE